MTAVMEAPATTPITPITIGASWTVTRSVLLAALKTAAAAVPSRPVVPIMAACRFIATDSRVTVTGFDFETAVSVDMPAEVITPGMLLIGHAEITKLVNALSKGMTKRDADRLPVTVRAQGNDTAVLDMAGYTMPLTHYPAQDYPVLPPLPVFVARVDREAFSAEVARLHTAACRDETLPVLNGLGLDVRDGSIRLASTDRYRLAVAELPAATAKEAEGMSGIVIPVHNLAGVVKLFTGPDVRIHLEKNGFVGLCCGDVTVTARLIEGEFVKYDRLIDHEWAGSITLDRQQVTTAVDRAAAAGLALGASKLHGVLLRVEPDAVRIAPVAEDRDDEVVAPPVPASLRDMFGGEKIMVNPGYLADALGSFTEPQVTIHWVGMNKPVLCTAEGADSSYRHLVMSMRIPG